MKIEILHFDGLFVIKDFLDWPVEVEFVLATEEMNRALSSKWLAYCLKEGLIARWINCKQRTFDKERIGWNLEWMESARSSWWINIFFLQIMNTLSASINIVTKYTERCKIYIFVFHKFDARVDIQESKSQKIPKFIDELRANIQEKHSSSWTILSDAIRLALDRISTQQKQKNHNLKPSFVLLQWVDIAKGRTVAKPPNKKPALNTP